MNATSINTIAILASVAGICFLPSIVANWVASKPWHWSLRYAVIFSLTIPALLIEAPDLAVVIATWTSLIFVGVLFSSANHESAFQKSLQPSDSKWNLQKWKAAIASFPQWTFIDVLLFTAVVAGWGLLVSQDFSKQNISMLAMVLVGVAFGLTSLMGRWFALGGLHWTIRTGLFLGLIFLVGLAEHFTSATWLESPLFTSTMWGTLFSLKTVTKAAALNLILTLAFCLLKSRPLHIPENLRQYPVYAKLYQANAYFHFTLLWLVILLATVSVSYLFLKLLVPPIADKKFDPLPPGGSNFGNLVQIGKHFDRINLFNGMVQMKPGTTTRNLLLQHADQFEDVRLSLLNPDLTWRDWQTPEDFDFSNFDEAMYTRAIARALVAKARQQSHDRQHDAALESGVICSKLPAPLLKDGILVNSLVAIAIESIGLQIIQRSVVTASKEALEKAAEGLAEIQNAWPSLQEVISTDKSICWYGSNWKDKIAMLCSWDTFDNSGSELAFIRSKIWRDLMRVTLAIEIYQRKHRRYPQTLNELIPEHLDSIPIDPHSENGSQIVYRVNAKGTEYQVYSLGRDQQDDNGKVTYDEDGAIGDINLAEHFKINERESFSTMADDPADAPP